ncbi:MAG TPA: hypothetical protein VF802_08330 [Candidatus Limnocylindrales bacterium]
MTSLRAALRAALAASALAGSTLAGGALAAPIAGGAPLGVVRDCVGAGTNHAAVVVEHGDGRVVRACVAFASAAISGTDLLRLSGIEYATSSYAGLGDAVCQLDGEPATYPAGCWSASSPYWVLFVARVGGSWAVAPVGMSSLSFGDGDAEGFRYQPQAGAAQAPQSPARCPSPSPTAPPATASLTTSATPRPAANLGTTAPSTSTRSTSAPSTSAVSPALGPGGIVATPAVPVPGGDASPLGGGAVVPGDTAASESLSALPTPGPAPAVAESSARSLPAWLAVFAAIAVLGGLGLGAARRRGRSVRR